MRIKSKRRVQKRDIPVSAYIEMLEDRQLLSANALLGMMTPTYFHHRQNDVAVPTVEIIHSKNDPTPAQLVQAYGINQLPENGAGITVAVIDAYHDATLISDANKFSTNYSLPQFNIAGGPTLQALNETGGTTLPTATNGIWNIEEALDVEYVHAIAPMANIDVIECNSANYPDLLPGAKEAASLPGVSVVSMSFSANEYGPETFNDSFFAAPPGHQGVTFLASTGDGGDVTQYPAASPNVVAVGGTNLTTDAAGNYISESYWSGGGGGISQFESQPSYQNGKVNGLSSTLRVVPDVSMDAGSAVPIVYNGSTTSVGGTSLSVVLWNGVIALADQGIVNNGGTTIDGVTQTLPALYNLPSNAFNVLGGGYNVDTGLGTPKANILVPDLVSEFSTVQQSNSPVFTSSNSATFVEGNALNFTVTATGTPTPTITETGTLPTGVTFNSITHVLSGIPTTTGTYNLVFIATNSAGTITQNFVLIIANPSPATSLQTVSMPTTGTAGTTLAPIVINVLNSTGTIATLNNDTFLVRLVTNSSSSIPFFYGSAVTVQPVNGVLTFNNLIPDVAGTFTLTVEDTVVSCWHNYTITIAAGILPTTPTSPVVNAGSLYAVSLPTTVVAGQVLAPIVLNTLNTNYVRIVSNDTFQAVLQQNGNNVPFAPGSTITVQAVNGIITFNNLIIPTTAGGTYSLILEDTQVDCWMKATLTVTTGLQTPTVAVTDAGGTYNGQSFPATATVNGGSTLQGVGLTLSYYNGTTLLSGAPTTAGNYSVTANFAGSTGYSASSATTTFSITQATPVVNVTAQNVSYGQPLNVTATVNGGSTLENVGLTLAYYNNGTLLSAPPTSAGNYTVVANFAGSQDYKAVSNSATFSIGQITPTVIVTNTGGVYNGNPFATTGTINGSTTLEGVGITFSYYNGTTLLPGAPTTAGTYTVIANFAGSIDYLAGTASTTFTIAQAEPVIDINGSYNGHNLVFTGTIAGIDGIFNSSLEGVSLVTSYYSNGVLLSNPPTQPGTYTEVISFAGSQDYLASQLSLDYTLV